MMRIIQTLLVLLFLAASAAPVFAQEAGPRILPAAQSAPFPSPKLINASGCTRSDIPAANPDFEQQVVEIANQERWNNGQLPPLKRSDSLDLAARYHAKDMAVDNYFEHDSYDGSGGTTFVCAWSTRISIWYSGWNMLAENIAAGQQTPEEVMSAWMNSAGHRANLLDADLREIGVGYYAGYWVQDFGRKNSLYPVVINAEAAQTATAAVTLHIYGDAAQFPTMRVQNDGESWSAWQPYSETLAWNLRAAKGIRTVTVELRRANATTISNTDSIELTQGVPELGGLPAQLNFTYNIASGRWITAPTALQPLNVGDDQCLNWSASKSDSWISLNQTSGVTPSTALNISINIDTTVTGSYDGSLTIQVLSPQSAAGTAKTIPVHVEVVNLDNTIFLPALMR